MENRKMEPINVTRSSMPPFEEYCVEIRELWDSRWLTNNGKKHEELRTALADYLDVERMDLFTNGHMAIELGLQALELGEGEVITTPFTFASTTQAIVRCGLEPVFCDIDPVTFTMDPAKIEALITPRTRAIVPVHVYGNICDVEAIQEIADRHGLKVLYDASHVFGVRYKGRSIASFGDVSCFSFHATKVYHTIEGGAACFRDEAIGKKLARLKNFGIADQETVSDIGPNAKMNEFCAAMGLCNLRHVAEEIEKRGRAAARYRERLEGVAGIQLDPIQKDVTPNHAYFPAVFDETRFGAGRDTVFETLAQHGIGARKYFYPLTNTFDCYHGRFDPAATPVALDISRRVLTLPLYADMDTDTVDRVCDVILRCKR